MTEDLAALEARVDAEDAATRARLLRPDALGKAAAWYAKNGIAVFPLRPGMKTPATRNGFKDATCDPGQVKTWWLEVETFNIGLPTGLKFDVIDVDPPDGFTSLAELRGAGAIPPTIGYAITPRRGAHLYIPAGGHGNAAGMLPGIDWRGVGGYTVGPPSRSELGMWVWTTPLVLP